MYTGKDVLKHYQPNIKKTSPTYVQPFLQILYHCIYALKLAADNVKNNSKDIHIHTVYSSKSDITNMNYPTI